MAKISEEDSVHPPPRYTVIIEIPLQSSKYVSDIESSVGTGAASPLPVVHMK